MIHSGMTPSTDASDASVEFLQRRVATFGCAAAQIGSAFLLFRVALAALGPFEKRNWLVNPSLWLHVVAILLFATAWLVCRKGVRTRQCILWMDVVSTIGGCIAYIAMTVFLPVGVRPEMVAILVLTYTMVARSVHVPSTPRRTVVFGAIVAVPLLASTYIAYSDLDTELWTQLVPAFYDLTKASGAQCFTFVAAMWWVLTVFVCQGASRLIFGLRREMRDVRRLGQYTLRDKVGEGGMGVVYAADHAMLRRPTAIKLLPPDKMGEEAVRRFEREVQLTAGLSHPNTITIYDYGRTPDGVFYYAMEFLDGATLAELVDTDGPQPAGRVVAILDQIAGALSEAHGVGLIHRDIKPSNIMLLEQGGEPDFVKVLDFGLVKELGSPQDAQLTQMDSITGTPQYLAPEAMLAPSTVGPRSDLYALGAVGYYLLTGGHAFTGETPMAVLNAHINTEPDPPSERLGKPVAAGLEKLILDCLRKKPEERPESANDLRLRLAALEGIEPFTTEQARAWWNERRAAVCPECRSKAMKGQVAATLEIDRHEHLAAVRR